MYKLGTGRNRYINRFQILPNLQDSTPAATKPRKDACPWGVLHMFSVPLAPPHSPITITTHGRNLGSRCSKKRRSVKSTWPRWKKYGIIWEVRMWLS